MSDTPIINTEGITLNLRRYDPFDWYWQIGQDDSHVFSSARAQLVSANDADYRDWLDRNVAPSKIASKDDLHEVLTRQVPDVVAKAGAYFRVAAKQPNTAEPSDNKKADDKESK